MQCEFEWYALGGKGQWISTPAGERRGLIIYVFKGGFKQLGLPSFRELGPHLAAWQHDGAKMRVSSEFKGDVVSRLERDGQ